MKRIAILGAGGMGTAGRALLFTKRPRRRFVSGPDLKPMPAELARRRLNDRHLPGIRIPDQILICELRQRSHGWRRACRGGCAHGIPPVDPGRPLRPGSGRHSFSERGQGHRVRDAGQAQPDHCRYARRAPVAVLSGPSHAEEIARGLPASVVVAGIFEGLNQTVQENLCHESFRVYTNPDAVGVELAGALKNVLGIAAGICDGLGFGDNAKAALLTRGLVEITRMGVALGGQQATFYGLAGVGDLITTCYSPFGRNREVGERIGRGETLEEILAGMVNVAEGVPTTRSVHGLALKLGIDMPITAELHRVLFEGKDPRSAVSDLMVRLPKVEWEL